MHLEPCPFCQSTYLGIKQPDGWLTPAWVECEKCGATGPAADTPESAYEAWNDRK